MENTILCRQRGATMSHVSLVKHPANIRFPNFRTFQPSNLPTCASPPAPFAAPRKVRKNNSPVFTLFRTLLPRPKCQPLPFQTVSHSFAKTPGVGYPQLLSTPHPCTGSQKHAPASPLLATLTDAINHKPCVCHSYKNTGGVHPLHENFHSLCHSLRSRHPPGNSASAVLDLLALSTSDEPNSSLDTLT